MNNLELLIPNYSLRMVLPRPIRPPRLCAPRT